MTTPRVEQNPNGTWGAHCPHCPWHTKRLPFPDPDAALHALALHAALCKGATREQATHIKHEPIALPPVTHDHP